MGVHQNISYDKFPRQGDRLGNRVKVCFNYQASKAIGGVIVRDDREDPGVTLIKLDDGRYVEAGECQYSMEKEG